MPAAETINAAASRLATGRIWSRLTVLGLLGAVSGLGQAPYDLQLLTLVILATIMLIHRAAATVRSAFWNGWAFGAGYFALTLHWIVNPFQVDAARDGWMAPFAVVLMAGGAALFWGIAFGLARRLRLQSCLALVILWTGAEAARALIFTGFPWALIGHVWIGTPFAQLAAFVGPHGLTLLTLLAAALLAGIVASPRRVWGGVVLALGAAAWPLLDPGPAPAGAADAPVIRIVQPNAPQDEKWDPERAPIFFARMITATGQGDAPALVVWPETAISTLLEWSEPSLELIADTARGAPVVLGVNRRAGARYYNSLVVLERGARIAATYDKAHLVPFGEYIPFGEWLGRFGIQGLAASQGGGFSAGDAGTLIDLPGVGLARPLICYEGIFAEEVGQMSERPRLMLMITNDAWFGQDAGPFQHLAQARLRAIEQGLPMVRAANTGISAMIDGKGRVTGQIALGVDGSIDVALPPALAATVYARFGDWPVLLLLVFTAAGLIVWPGAKPIDPEPREA